MTEEEAKTKVCPQGAMRGAFDGNWDRGNCLASACMAWRWDREIYNPNSGETVTTISVTTIPFERSSTTHGRCGLAGT